MRRYGLCNLGFAGLYVWVGFVLAPGRSLAFNAALALVSGILLLSGVGLLAEARWGRALAIAACVLLLVFTGVVLLGLVASSAYLRGIYGPLGQGMAVVCLLIAALVVEGFALLPLFELRFLLGRRRA
jgi:hypothetical protein